MTLDDQRLKGTTEKVGMITRGGVLLLWVHGRHRIHCSLDLS